MVHVIVVLILLDAHLTNQWEIVICLATAVHLASNLGAHRICATVTQPLRLGLVTAISSDNVLVVPPPGYSDGELELAEVHVCPLATAT
jgi:hypothetical protein